MSRSNKPTERAYVVVFAALALLLVATMVADRFPFGTANLIVAMAIAVVKALLIAVYFMHLRVSSTTVRLTAAAGLLWLGHLMVLTLSDYLTRGWNEPSGGQLVEQQLPETYDRVEPGGR